MSQSIVSTFSMSGPAPNNRVGVEKTTHGASLIEDIKMSKERLKKKISESILLITIILGVTSPVFAVPQMVAHWPLADGSGSVATETVAGLNGALMNFDTSTAWTADAPHGGALTFDGVDDYVVVPHNAAIDFANESFSVSFLLKQNGGFVAPSDTSFTEQRYFSKGTFAATTGVRYEMFNKAGNVRFSIDDGTTKIDVSVAEAPFVTNEWVHVVAVRDTAQAMMFLYADGVQVGSIATGALGSAANPDPLVFGTSTAADKPTSIGFFAGQISDFRIFANALTVDEIAAIYGYSRPEDGATDVERDVVLCWTQSESAVAYNVYFGTSFDEVQDANVNSPLLVGRGIDANTFEPGRLEYGRTYYWRVDEIGAPAESKVLKGDVWSFTVEPFAATIAADGITATASSTMAGSSPANTINQSGLSDDLHSTDRAAMWSSESGVTAPVWIQYDFDQVYKLYEMWVWNYNSEFEYVLSFGLKDVTVEYSADGATWNTLGDYELPDGPGADRYAHDTTVSFGGVAAQSVKITAHSNYGGSAYGLSEVRFYAIPTRAGYPQPTDGATGVATDATLTWRAGREAVSHEVYIGADSDSLTLADTVTPTSYSTSWNLDTTYYWRVDEVNLAATVSTWTGAVWSFTTVDHSVLDDMESYNDTTNKIFDVWADGYKSTTNGAVVGLDASANGTFGSTTIYHGGKQSMPYTYGANGITNSEATRTFSPAQDWTLYGAETLSLYFYGQTTNTTTVPFWVRLTDSNGKSAKVTFGSGTGEDVAALATESWTAWNIPLSNFSGVTFSTIKSMTIGLGAGTGSGTLYIDDIFLY
jgi:hypothetical protein